MKNERLLGLVFAAVMAVGPFLAPAASAPPDEKPPAASAPASPKLNKELERKWRWYKVTWAGTDVAKQLDADRQVVNVLLQGELADVAALREAMIAEYRRLAAEAEADDFPCGRLAARIAVAWMRLPVKLPPVEMAPAKKAMCEQVVEWATVSLEHLTGTIPDDRLQQYKIFILSTVTSMASVLPSRAVLIDAPGDVARRLAKIQPRLAVLAALDADREAKLKAQFDALHKAAEPFGRLQADKQAVRSLLETFQTAYNARDDKTFVALWPQGHPATASLKTKTLQQRIPPQQWKIDRWQLTYTIVQGDLAQTYIRAQYRSKDGKLGPIVLQPYLAKRDPNLGWRLN